MDTNTHSSSQTHKIHSCKHSHTQTHTQRQKNTSAEDKGCYGQLTLTGHSQAQILELKRTPTLSKQLPLYKPKGTPKSIINFLATTLKSETLVKAKR